MSQGLGFTVTACLFLSFRLGGYEQLPEIRHTFAVRAIEIPEFDVKSLSEILGHKNVSFTLNVYGSANLQQKVKCMNLLNDLL